MRPWPEYYSKATGVISLGPEATESSAGAAAGASELQLRVRQLERELGRARRSRRVLMELLWRLDRDWRRRVQALEEENRRLWSVRGRQGPA